jgi:hypothetical protein
MLKNLYVVGGRQRAPRPLSAGNGRWTGYQQGVILRIDTSNGEWEEALCYVSPPDVLAPEDAAINFQAGTIKDNVLYICTQTEVLIYGLPDFEQLGYVSLPIFNDLHHVYPTPTGSILVANAGLEMVMEVTLEGQVLRSWNVLGEDCSKISSEIDYRKISTKPHRSHPNYLFYLDSQPWATRFHQGDAICLTQPDKQIQISTERIHDGVVHDGHIYFSSVNGCIYIANTTTLMVERVVYLNRIHSNETLLGWCRSLLVDEDKLWVGFSRIRPTKWRENVGWVMRGFKDSRPTHIACYDLSKNECVTEIDVESLGLNVIYSIFPVVV